MLTCDLTAKKQMPYFLYDGFLEVGQTADFSGEEARHALQVRRLCRGESLILQDANYRRFEASLLEKQHHSASLMIEKELTPPQESPLQLEVMIALCKEKALHFAVQKLTELGVSRIIVFRAERSPVSFYAKLLAKWQRVALEACKQSERWKPPQIDYFVSLADALKSCEPLQKQWVLHLTSSLSFNSSDSCLSCRVIIGAEGGFTDKELEICQASRYQIIGCGSRTLRTETAATAIAAHLQFLYGDL